MDRDTMAAVMSSGTTIYETPDDLFGLLDGLFHFVQDVCATEDNAKVPGNFISPEQDAFKTDWQSPFFMNPPYGRGENQCKPGCLKLRCTKRGCHISQRIPGIDGWVKRARDFGEDGLGVCLLPSRTAENWIQTVFDDASLILFVRGRLRFKVNGVKITGAPFPSIVAVFGFIDFSLEDVAHYLKKIGNVVISEAGIVQYDGGKP